MREWAVNSFIKEFLNGEKDIKKEEVLLKIFRNRKQR